MNKYPARFADRRNDLAMIHMAAARLGLDTADKNESSEYRALMFSATRKHSSVALDFAGRKRFLDTLNGLLAARGLEKVGGKQPRKLADDPQSRKIRALWLELHAAGKVRNPSESALAAFVKRQTGRDALQWLNGREASAVIEDMKKWLARPTKA